jgi:hypothetical protein
MRSIREIEKDLHRQGAHIVDPAKFREAGVEAGTLGSIERTVDEYVFATASMSDLEMKAFVLANCIDGFMQAMIPEMGQATAAEALEDLECVVIARVSFAGYALKRLAEIRALLPGAKSVAGRAGLQ